MVRDQTETFAGDRVAKRKTLEFVRAYHKIQDAKVRKRLFEMIKALGAAASVDD